MIAQHPVTENVWAKGLSATYTEKGWEVSGWYDAQKTSTQGDMDDNMCYAASAANLLAWWQNGEDALESEAPRELDTIWKTLVDNNQIQSFLHIFSTPLLVTGQWCFSWVAPPHEKYAIFSKNVKNCHQKMPKNVKSGSEKRRKM